MNSPTSGGTPVTLLPPAVETCPVPTCNISIIINGTVYKPEDVVTLPLGNTLFTYVITDPNNKTATSPTSINVAGPPDITAPAPAVLNATTPAGASYVIPQSADQYCGRPQCIVAVLVNGTQYKPDDTIPVLPGTTQLTYIITDSTGVTSQDTTSVTVNGPPEIVAPPPRNVTTSDPAGASITLPPPANVYCGIPNCTVTAVVNGTSYPVGSTVLLPANTTTPLTYVVIDGTGVQTANDTTSITVPPASVYVMACKLMARSMWRVVSCAREPACILAPCFLLCLNILHLP